MNTILQICRWLPRPSFFFAMILVPAAIGLTLSVACTLFFWSQEMNYAGQLELRQIDFDLSAEGTPKRMVAEFALKEADAKKAQATLARIPFMYSALIWLACVICLLCGVWDYRATPAVRPK